MAKKKIEEEEDKLVKPNKLPYPKNQSKIDLGVNKITYGDNEKWSRLGYTALAGSLPALVGIGAAGAYYGSKGLSKALFKVIPGLKDIGSEIEKETAENTPTPNLRPVEREHAAAKEKLADTLMQKETEKIHEKIQDVRRVSMDIDNSFIPSGPPQVWENMKTDSRPSSYQDAVMTDVIHKENKLKPIQDSIEKASGIRKIKEPSSKRIKYPQDVVMADAEKLKSIQTSIEKASGVKRKEIKNEEPSLKRIKLITKKPIEKKKLVKKIKPDVKRVKK